MKKMQINTAGDTIRVLQSRMAQRRAVIADHESHYGVLSDLAAIGRKLLGSAKNIDPLYAKLMQERKKVRQHIVVLAMEQKADRVLKNFVERFIW